MLNIENIKAQLTVTDYLEYIGVELRRNACACPIHGGDNKTAFTVSRDAQLWHCFTRAECGGGDVITLIQKVELCDVAQALRIAAQIAGIDDDNATATAHRRPPPPPARPTPPPPLLLKSTELHVWAFDYLRGRGLDAALCEQLGLTSGTLNGVRCVLFGYRQQADGVIIGIRGRKIHANGGGDKIMAATGSAFGRGLFFVRYSVENRRLYIVEGELNGVAVAHSDTQANVVSVGSQILTDWQLATLRKLVSQHNESIVFFDRHDVARGVARSLGARVKHIDSGETDANGNKTLQGKIDANDLLRAGLLEAFLLSRNMTVK